MLRPSLVPDDAQIDAVMDRYAAGESDAFAELYRLLYPRFLSYFTRMWGASRSPEDLIQEVFLRIHRARGLFTRGAPALPWAYAIARNVLIDHSRAARLRAPIGVQVDELPDRADGAADGESAAVASETARTIERVLQEVPASQREAFILVRYEGLAVKDAAKVLGATPIAVKLRAFRVYEALRAALAAAAADSAKLGRAPKPTTSAAVSILEEPVRARPR